MPRSAIAPTTEPTAIARSNPAWSGALALGAGAGATRGAYGRAAAVPVLAKSLGGGRSALKPAASGGIAVVFDAATGKIVSRCTGVAATAAPRDLTATDLSSCTSGTWLLLGGTIRFTAAVPPQPSQASDAPPGAAVALTLSGGSYAATRLQHRCDEDGALPGRWQPAHRGRADRRIAGIARPRLVERHRRPLRRLPLPRHAARRRPLVRPQHAGPCRLDDRHRQRRPPCLPLRRRPRWLGAIDANIEHPADYAGVAGALPGQNFLVARGDQSCPAAPDASLLAAATGTVQYQP